MGNATGKRPVYIGAFLPSSSLPSHSTLVETLQVAVDHVNNLTGILDDFELRLRWNWTETEPGRGLLIMNEFVREGPPVLMAWGPHYSKVAVILNEVMPRYDIVQVSTASSSSLKDRSRYPLTLQAGGDENHLNPARVEFVKRMGWKRVAIIFEDNQYFRKNIEHLAVLLTESDVTILTMESVKEAENSDEQLNNLKRHDARVIFIGFYAESATTLFCKIYRADLFGSKYVWLLPGWFQDEWWKDNADVSCTHDELQTALNFYIGFNWDFGLKDLSLMDLNGIKLYPEQLEDVSKLEFSAPRAYDCLLTIALALNSSIRDLQKLIPPRRLDDFNYGDTEMADVFWNHSYRTKFVGATGPVEFTEDFGRKGGNIFIVQLKGNNVVKLATLHPNGQYTTVANTSIEWRGSRQPVDGVSETKQFLSISYWHQSVMFILAGCGVMTAFIFLSLNIYFRKERAIKISSPQINNLIVCGCLLLYSSVFVSGMNTTGMNETEFIILCYTNVLLTCVGISLSFGSLLIKTYRIFAIFKIAVAKFKKIDLPDRKLMFFILILVLLDFLLVTLRSVIGQAFVHNVHLDTKLIDPIEEIYIIPVFRQCEYHYGNVFTGALYSLKGIMFVFGIFLAWETREVTIKGINDSKYIALSILIVGVTIALTIPALQVLSNDIDLQFSVYSSAVIFANTTVLCMVFVPKLRLFKTHRNTLQTSMWVKTTRTTSAESFPPSRSRLTDLQTTLDKEISILKELVTVYRRSSDNSSKPADC
ncbi:gamma-aminobutyric acid type B receptor subunit 2-like [Asterias amurensis]|uniref:gamma-aminobutyric acid type B receptor subunit 2-like n=1 Tax=Asterias amurensis TaxID=7602 RepID=UPI003AB75341